MQQIAADKQSEVQWQDDVLPFYLDKSSLKERDFTLIQPQKDNSTGFLISISDIG